jgi:hypothetical protein
LNPAEHLIYLKRPYLPIQIHATRRHALSCFLGFQATRRHALSCFLGFLGWTVGHHTARSSSCRKLQSPARLRKQAGHKKRKGGGGLLYVFLVCVWPFLPPPLLVDESTDHILSIVLQGGGCGLFRGARVDCVYKCRKLERFSERMVEIQGTPCRCCGMQTPSSVPKGPS